MSVPIVSMFSKCFLLKSEGNGRVSFGDECDCTLLFPPHRCHMHVSLKAKTMMGRTEAFLLFLNDLFNGVHRVSSVCSSHYVDLAVLSVLRLFRNKRGI